MKSIYLFIWLSFGACDTIDLCDVVFYDRVRSAYQPIAGSLIHSAINSLLID